MLINFGKLLFSGMNGIILIVSEVEQTKRFDIQAICIFAQIIRLDVIGKLHKFSISLLFQQFSFSVNIYFSLIAMFF